MRRANPYDDRYSRDKHYWGRDPTTIAKAVVEIGLPVLRGTFGDKIRIIDLGSGDGRDALYYAGYGLDVTCVDRSPSGINALTQKGCADGVASMIHGMVADLNEYRLANSFHAIVSSGALHYIAPGSRPLLFEHYKQKVALGGILAATVIVENPSIADAPDAEPDVSLFRPGELLGYLWDWKILWMVEEVRPCNSSGVPHEHALERVIVQKVR